MISYHWGDQARVKQIARSLREFGYQVWMDLEHIDGCTLEERIPTKEKKRNKKRRAKNRGIENQKENR